MTERTAARRESDAVARRRLSEGTPPGSPREAGIRPVKPSYRPSVRGGARGGVQSSEVAGLPATETPPRVVVPKRTDRARAEVYPTLGQAWPTWWAAICVRHVDDLFNK